MKSKLIASLSASALSQLTVFCCCWSEGLGFVPRRDQSNLSIFCRFFLALLLCFWRLRPAPTSLRSTKEFAITKKNCQMKLICYYRIFVARNGLRINALTRVRAQACQCFHTAIDFSYKISKNAQMWMDYTTPLCAKRGKKFFLSVIFFPAEQPRWTCTSRMTPSNTTMSLSLIIVPIQQMVSSVPAVTILTSTWKVLSICLTHTSPILVS